MSEAETKTSGVVWILVDHSSREATYEGVGELLSARGVEVHVATINEVLGTGLKDALSGGAERLLRGLRVAMRGRNQDEDLLGAVKRARPDLLAVTNASHVRALGLLESVSGISSLQVGVFADYDFDPAWSRSSLQAFVVPHESFRDRLVRDGFPADRILLAGPAINASFARELDRAAERESLGLGEERAILIRAETLDSQVLEKLVFQATLVEANSRFIFHHNGDQVVATALRKAAAQYGLKAAMFGKVDDLERYVLAADAVVASPLDPFVPEILALDRPLMFLGSPDGGASQVEFLTEINAARSVQDVLRFGSELERMLEGSSLEKLETAAAELSQKRGSAEVAEALIEALKQREAWMQPPDIAPSDTPDDDAEPEEDEADSNSPFETIGDTTPASTSSKTNEPSFSGLSKAEAKDQLAALILTERDIEKKQAEAEKQQTRWRGRLEMAREWNEEDLAKEAESILRGYMDEAERLEKERASVQRQKQKLKEAALGGSAGGSSGAEAEAKLSDIEKRFRKMEVDSDLDDLKDRIRREMGD